MLYFFRKISKKNQNLEKNESKLGFNGMCRVRPITGDHNIPVPSKNRANNLYIYHENDVLHTLFLITDFI